MPIMIRSKGKGKKIAYDILGIPANLIKHKMNSKERRKDKKLTAQETSRSR